ncbi:MAG: hypothetical protein WDZ80_06695 [Candidatus Paceibacterota bacterium]
MRENFFANKIDRSLEKKRHKGETYLRKSEEIIKEKSPAERINEEDFKDVYGEEEIKVDLEKISRMEEKHKDNQESNEFGKRYADVLETVITDAGEKNNWFGPDIKINRASKFDDYFNGTDLIFELGSPDNLLAVDLTYSKGWGEVSQKIRNVKETIDSEKLIDIKYFQSKTDNKKENKNKIPKVVVALSFEELTKIARLWSAESAPISEKAKEAHRKMLDESSVQVEILQQVISQLEVFINYSEQNNKEELVEKFSKILEKFKELSHSEKAEKINKKLIAKGLISENEDYKLGRTRELDSHLEREFFLGKAA